MFFFYTRTFNDSKAMKPWLHPRASGGMSLNSSLLSSFHFFPLTHHLKVVRQCESSFTTENFTGINFPLLFLALAGQRKRDRFHGFCPQGCTSFSISVCCDFLPVWDSFAVAVLLYVRTLIAFDVCGIYSFHTDSLTKQMHVCAHVYHMHVHTSTLHVLWN